jgi:AcrR family transcriptional regulator
VAGSSGIESRELAFMTIKTATRPPQGGAADRLAALRHVMEVISEKGFAKTSIADLRNAAGLGYAALHKAFGTREDILRAAIRSCAETEALLAHEPLRVSPTGRESVLAMLEENVRLRRHWPRYCGCLFTSNALIVPAEENELHEFLVEKRRTLAKHIRARLVQSVTEGELPARVNCEALANLCLTLLSGLNVRILDGTPPALLFRSIEIFVDSLGFRARRRT